MRSDRGFPARAGGQALLEGVIVIPVVFVLIFGGLELASFLGRRQQEAWTARIAGQWLWHQGEQLPLRTQLRGVQTVLNPSRYVESEIARHNGVFADRLRLNAVEHCGAGVTGFLLLTEPGTDEKILRTCAGRFGLQTGLDSGMAWLGEHWTTPAWNISLWNGPAPLVAEKAAPGIFSEILLEKFAISEVFSLLQSESAQSQRVACEREMRATVAEYEETCPAKCPKTCAQIEASWRQSERPNGLESWYQPGGLTGGSDEDSGS